ncbi:hypothetical protein LUTEI9C_100233 [Luteimonas sp. 9C]|nr:hypothetical protein LUTEI9C_100233 [Luteimonas sp. 9C]
MARRTSRAWHGPESRPVARVDARRRQSHGLAPAIREAGRGGPARGVATMGAGMSGRIGPTRFE